ncbi:MAG: hypothetical protein EA378_07885 [Phycisphaerales bacterium]|nr:MAG: hypothetical protein EA378_07885 [Phycisphaerales bacterium]
MSSSEHPSAAALPYWSDYLKQVLRPRVESVLQEHMGSWNDVVWEVVARAVAEDQQGGQKMSPEQIRVLLQEQLAMQLEVDVSVRFGQPPASGADGGSGEATRADPSAKRDVIDPQADNVDVRRRVNISPLAKAVGGGRRD